MTAPIFGVNPNTTFHKVPRLGDWMVVMSSAHKKAVEEARAEGYDEGWKACQATLAAQQGMRLSRKATDTQRAAVKATLPRSGTKGHTLWELFIMAGTSGLTDDDVERKTGWTHQSASAARNMLMMKGLVRDSGKRRKNRRGLDCIIWERCPSSKETDDRTTPHDSSTSNPDGNLF